MKKITVSNIKAIQSIPKNSELILNLPSSSFISLHEDCIISQLQSVLTVTSLKDMNVIFSENIEVKNIKKVAKYGHLLGIICHEGNLLYCCDIRSGGMWTCEGHMEPINDLIYFDGYFITASKDMTIRLWQIMEIKIQNANKFERPLKFPIALKGHKGSVQTLCIYHNFLISGSNDKSMICWHNRQVYASFQFTDPIIKIQPCPFSSQVIVVTQDNMAHFVNIKTIINKKVEVKGSLSLESVSRPPFLAEIDESFLVLVCKDSIKFLEVNLMKEMHQIHVEGAEKICGLRCEGKCMFYGLLGKGVMILKI